MAAEDYLPEGWEVDYYSTWENDERMMPEEGESMEVKGECPLCRGYGKWKVGVNEAKCPRCNGKGNL